jgi:hypothetical protein
MVLPFQRRKPERKPVTMPRSLVAPPFTMGGNDEARIAAELSAERERQSLRPLDWLIWAIAALAAAGIVALVCLWRWT